MEPDEQPTDPVQNPAPPTQQVPEGGFDMNALATAMLERLGPDRLATALAAGLPAPPPTQDVPELTPVAFRLGPLSTTYSGFPVVTAANDTDNREGIYFQTSRIINALTTTNRDPNVLRDARERLLKAGAYDQHMGQFVDGEGNPVVDLSLRRSDEQKFVNMGMNTIIYRDGGVFVPDLIYSEIAMQEDVYGLVRQYAMRMPLVWGVQRYPKLTTKARFQHVGQGQEITTSKLGFGDVEMTPRKAGVIIPWTRETTNTAGARLMPLVNRVIAESREKLIDDDAINGDGSSQYGGIVGLRNHADVLVYTLASGKTSFQSADWQDYNRLRFQTAFDESGTMGAIYFAHPLSEQYFINLSVAQYSGDGVGAPVIFNMPGNQTTFENRNGRRVGRYQAVEIAFTESMPGPADNAVSTPFVGYGNFRNLLFGEIDGLVIDTMTEGTIQDPDNPTDPIRLGAQDYVALKVLVFVDMRVLFGNTFALMTTAAS